MNKYLLIVVLSIFNSCSEIEELPDALSSSSNVTTRLAGDGKYDVLGFGYDVTDEYLHPKSVKNPVLDIEKYEQDYRNRIISGTSSYGFDKMYHGYSSSDYIREITKETKATFSMNYGAETDTSFFSGNITNSPYFKSEYSYSEKYSFASLDAVRNRKQIRINDEISRLSQYLSFDFKEDLNRLSPERIIERYGTHVLTDFIIGGRYKLMFRSVIINTQDASTRKNAVLAGFNLSLGQIGFTYNLDHKETIFESLAKENHSKELYVLFFGGKGTSIKYDLEKGMPTSADIQNWENSVSLENSCLTEIIWKETYPIYDFVSDPEKKAVLKSAVKKYIASKQIKTLEIVPLYQYGKNRRFHYNTNLSSSGWQRDGVTCYVLPRQNCDMKAVPLYQFYKNNKMHYNTATYSLGWENQGVTCFIYKDKLYDELVPLYQFNHSDRGYHYNTSVYSLGWLNQGVVGYVFPQ